MGTKMGERIVKEESLVAVADAIRAKGGTTDALSFPTGFADAISAIQAGSSVGGAGTIHGRAFECGTFVCETEATLVEVKHSLGVIPTGAFVWTEEDWFADTTTQWKVGGIAIYTDVENGYGFAHTICKDSASSTTSLNRSYAQGETASGSTDSFYRPTGSSSGASTVYNMASTTSVVMRLGTSGKFPAGVEYKYILLGAIT